MDSNEEVIDISIDKLKVLKRKAKKAAKSLRRK